MGTAVVSTSAGPQRACSGHAGAGNASPGLPLGGATATAPGAAPETGAAIAASKRSLY
jgi:hypothetical protein